MTLITSIASVTHGMGIISQIVQLISTTARRVRGFFRYKYPEESDLIIVEPELVFSESDVLSRVIENPVIIEEKVPEIDVYAMARQEDEFVLLGIY